MGAGNSVEIPGGGTEGYHVLRVSIRAIHEKCHLIENPIGIVTSIS